MRNKKNRIETCTRRRTPLRAEALGRSGISRQLELAKRQALRKQPAFTAENDLPVGRYNRLLRERMAVDRYAWAAWNGE